MKNIIIIVIFLSMPLNLFPSPELAWSTFLGNCNSSNYLTSFNIDKFGNSFVAGATNSPVYPVTPGCYQDTLKGLTDVFVTKLNPEGNNLIFSTFIGGKVKDGGNDICIDNSGNSYIIGTCYNNNDTNNDYPITINAYNKNNHGSKIIFVTKLNSSGTALIYSTFIGPSAGGEIACDNEGNIYLFIHSYSTYPVTTGAYDTILNDMAITKLNLDGSKLIFSTFFGGNDVEYIGDIVIDYDGNSYITGGTISSDFPVTPGVFQVNLDGGGDVFFTKLNSAGTALIYSTLLGGDAGEEGYSIVFDNAHDSYITGTVYSYDFPTTTGSYQTSRNAILDMFVTEFNSDASSLIYSTFVGGVCLDEGNSIALDNDNNVYVIGITTSYDFPVTKDAIDTSINQPFCYWTDYDCVIFKLSNDGTKLPYSTFFGGKANDQGENIIFDYFNDIYISGFTGSPDFPVTKGAFDTSLNNHESPFVAKINLCDGISNIKTINNITFPLITCGSDYKDTVISFYNSGTCDLCLIEESFSGLDSSGCSLLEALPVYIKPNDSINLTVRFKPKKTIGFHNATLNIYNNSSNNPYYKINLSGSVDKIPQIECDTVKIFTDVKCSIVEADTFFIKNTGQCNLIIVNSNFSGLNSNQFSVIEPKIFPDTILTDSSLRFIIKFIPNDSIGIMKAELSLSNNTAINPYIINLSARNDSIAFNVNNSESDTIYIDLENICGGVPKDTTITIFNKSSIGTTFKIENKDPQLQIVPVGKAGKKEGDKPKKK
jgi:hypothetical protein